MGSAKRRKKKRSLMPILAFIVLISVLAVPTLYITSDDVNLDFISPFNQSEKENSDTEMQAIAEKENKGDDPEEQLTASLQDEIYEEDMEEPEQDIALYEPDEDGEPELPDDNSASDSDAFFPKLLAFLATGQRSDSSGWNERADNTPVTEKNTGEEDKVPSLPDAPPIQEDLSDTTPHSNETVEELPPEHREPLKDNESGDMGNNADKEPVLSLDQVRTQHNVSAESNEADALPVDEPAIREELNTTDTIEDPSVVVAHSSAAGKQENRETVMAQEDRVPKDARSQPAEQIVPEIQLAFKEDALNEMADKDRMEKELSSTLKEMYVTYEEPFNDNANNWDIFDTGTVSAKMEKGYYVIESTHHATTHIILHQHDFPHHLDFIIEATLQTERSEGDYSYGYVFGARDARNYLALQVTGNRSYAIIRSADGKREEIAAGRIMDAPVEHTSPVILKIERRGDDILFYVSSRFIGTLSHFQLAGKKVGFIVEGNVLIAIDKTRSQVRYQNQ